MNRGLASEQVCMQNGWCKYLNRRVVRRVAVGLKTATAVMLAVLMGIHPVFALPTGWEVIEGEVSFNQVDGNTLNITTNSQNAIVNYQTFSIGNGQTVNFILFNNSSSILNRVLGGGASQINGNLFSNGNVGLVNASGINFGANANVNVGSMMASTLNITDGNYLAGNYQFERDGAALSLIHI